MLVLTRRKDQKILFPNLGITVEVVDVSGKNVRLGIDAPRDVRIVRDEIERLDQPVADRSTPDIDQYQKPLDAAKLAIHLARNQMRQGRNAMADDALDQALACLQSVDRSLALPSSKEATSALAKEFPSDLVVNESSSGYHVSAPVDPCQSIGQLSSSLVFAGDVDQRRLINDTLRRKGIDQVAVCGEEELVPWLLQNDLPDVAMMICDPIECADIISDRTMDCFGALKQAKGFVQLAGINTVQWQKPGTSIDLAG